VLFGLLTQLGSSHITVFCVFRVVFADLRSIPTAVLAIDQSTRSPHHHHHLRILRQPLMHLGTPALAVCAGVTVN